MREPSCTDSSRSAKAVVFDCDGVLIESTEIKNRAFATLFGQYPEHHDAILTHHRQNVGISRFEKFAWIYRELLRRPLGLEESRSLGSRFSEIVRDAAITCSEVPGAGAALRRLRSQSLPLYVASGTPQQELVEILSARGLDSFFEAIYGSPTSKSSALVAVAEALAIAPEEIVMIGDGLTDLEAARDVGAQFIWRDTADQRAFFEDYSGPSLPDLVELPALLLGLAKPKEAKR